MVELEFTGGRLGDRMFEYAFGRIIAENLGFAYKPKMDSNFLTPFNLTEVPGEIYDEPVQNVCGRQTYEYNLLNKICENKEKRKIRIQGFFHLYEYYKDYMHKIKQWYRLEPKKELIKNAVGVHIRNTDYPIEWRNKPEYYIEILKKESPEKIYITSDEHGHESVQNILNNFPQAEIYNNPCAYGTMSDFSQLKTLILSNGSFSFWMGILSNAEKIYGPSNCVIPKYIDLIVYDDSRYKYLK